MNSKKSDLLRKPVKYLKGVGEARARLFEKLGINNLEDLITYYPREYDDRRGLKTIAELKDGDFCVFRAVPVTAVSETKPRHNLTIQKVLLKDETGAVIATWFNRTYLKRTLVQGKTYLFYGQVKRLNRTLQVQNPEFEEYDEENQAEMCKILPIYASTAGLTQKVFRKTVATALKMVDMQLEEYLPGWLRTNYYLSEINFSIYNIHFPKDEMSFQNARYRLVFEELLMLQLGLLLIKEAAGGTRKGIAFGHTEQVKEFLNTLPYELTNAQMRSLNEIITDMQSEKAMNRLLQGDVGSGKTVVAAAAIYLAIVNGYQGAMMAPTEILAEQHYQTLTKLFENFDIHIELLTGSMSKKQKQEAIGNISGGKANIIVGTHALIQEGVEFHRLGLVVTDEQHRFGVRQWALLSQKGENPDVLVMTATPIPRTLALILYGDLDISIIDELPPGRKPVKTYVVNNSMRERVNNFIRKKVGEGRQVYIVCPLVDESDAIEARSAIEMAENIAANDFSDLRVGLIHGKLSSKEKEQTMKLFAEGKIDILVSTTVIEVGVNVPNATVMVVEDAERFGLAQLHQLRGRVGRGDHQSYCILYNESNNEISRQRMEIMAKTNNGFVIAEKDLEIRGPGEFFGTRQHGIPQLKIANLYKDLDILKKAQQAAFEIMNNRHNQKNEETNRFLEEVTAHFNEKLKELSLT